jgi:hypothetical protein
VHVEPTEDWKKVSFLEILIIIISLSLSNMFL